MLICNVCGRIESEPYCDGDACYDGCGIFRKALQGRGGEMNDFYCPAEKCFCRSVNWEANCSGVSIGNANKCIRPKRKSPLTLTEIKEECNAEHLAGYDRALSNAKAAVIAVLNANGSPSVGVAIIKAIEGVK